MIEDRAKKTEESVQRPCGRSVLASRSGNEAAI